MNAIPKFSGIIKFRVKGQRALPPFQQELNRRFIALGGEMPEALRYQCRIATDARENLKLVKLDNGETLTLSPSVAPQFGKNRHGQTYLTATMLYSGDGLYYRVNWTGAAVPEKMARIAVAHDLGKYVRAAVIPLDLAAADVRPSWKVQGRKGPGRAGRDYEDEETRRTTPKSERTRAGRQKRGSRTCRRTTAADLVA